MKLYDKIKIALTNCPEYRDSDKKLTWYIWTSQGLTSPNSISIGNFISKAISPETISRARRKVQENYPGLRSNKGVQKQKDIKQSSKGTFVYKEELSLFK
jgi:hypothetical protein